jgi:hypothetical protein
MRLLCGTDSIFKYELRQLYASKVKKGEFISVTGRRGPIGL